MRGVNRRVAVAIVIAVAVITVLQVAPASAKSNNTSTWMYNATGDNVPYGTPVTFHVEVQDDSQSCQTIFDDCDNPEGTVTLYNMDADGIHGTPLKNGTLHPQFNNNEVSVVDITLEDLAPGFYRIRAQYFPYTTEFAGSRYGDLGLTVNKLNCAITLKQDSSQTYKGEKVTFSADFGGTGHSGTVTFTDAANNVLHTTNEIFFGAVAKFETTSLPLGTTQVKASLSNPNYNPCTSNAVSHAVLATAPPRAEAGGPYFAYEGGLVALNSAGSSAGNGPGYGTLSYAWDVDYDGDYDLTGAAPSYAESNDGFHYIGLEVTNGAGLVAHDYSWIDVFNVAPNVSPTLGGDLLEGSTISLGGTAYDPADAMSATVDWGDGSPVQSALGGPIDDGALTYALQGTHVYGDDGTFTVRVCVTDDDTSTCWEDAITIANVAPQITIDEIAAAVAEGGTAVLDVAVVDPGALDTFSVEVDWGTGDGFVPMTPGTISQAFGDNGQFVVKVRAVDDEGGASEATSPVTVGNVAPTLSIDKSGAVQTAGGPVVIGGAVGLAAQSTDTGSDDLMALWDLGLGGPGVDFTEVSLANPPSPDPSPSPSLGARAVQFTAGYAGAEARLYNTSVFVQDDDGGTTPADSVFVLVQGSDPQARVAPWWAMQYDGHGAGDAQLSDERLACYLEAVRFMSAAFGESIALDTSDDALSVLRPRGPLTPRTRLAAVVLASWLDLANGGFGPADIVSALQAAEAALLDPDASRATLDNHRDVLERAIAGDRS